jgi:hypothetical protein
VQFLRVFLVATCGWLHCFFPARGMTCFGAARVAVAALIDAVIPRSLVRFRE